MVAQHYSGNQQGHPVVDHAEDQQGRDHLGFGILGKEAKNEEVKDAVPARNVRQHGHHERQHEDAQNSQVAAFDGRQKRVQHGGRHQQVAARNGNLVERQLQGRQGKLPAEDPHRRAVKRA